MSVLLASRATQWGRFRADSATIQTFQMCPKNSCILREQVMAIWLVNTDCSNPLLKSTAQNDCSYGLLHFLDSEFWVTWLVRLECWIWGESNGASPVQICADLGLLIVTLRSKRRLDIIRPSFKNPYADDTEDIRMIIRTFERVSSTKCTFTIY